MSRRRRGKPVSGWAILDKTVGVTSTRAVSMVRRAFDAQKAGHGGTLDPLASGILPIALGEATKLIFRVMDGRKTYRFTVRWGEARDTDDAEGDITETSIHRPSSADIAAVLSEFIGEIDQIPPAFSAVKIDGKRAYDLARAGAAVTPKSRRVTIFALELLETPDRDSATFEVRCGKGTYVRSLGRDIARRLGTVGYISALRRTATGPFNEKCAISLDNFDSLVHIAPPSGFLLPVEAALDDIPAFSLNPEQADHMRHGRAVQLFDLAEDRSFEALNKQAADDLVCAMADGRLVALARVEDGKLCPARVLNQTD